MQRLTIPDFNLLPSEDQLYLLAQEGTLLARREQSSCLIRLYALDLFYVEVHYNFKRKTMVRMASFKGISGLEPYLQQLDLTVK